MDSKVYGKKAAEWNVKRRQILEATLTLIEPHSPELARILSEALSESPVPKPAKHGGGPESDFFEVRISKADAQRVVDLLFDMESAAVPLDDSDSREAGRIAALVDEWNRVNWDD